MVVVVGLAVTVALVLVAHSTGARNEKHLLALRVKDAESVLTAGLPDLQTPLASAAALADATHGSRKKFRRFIAPYVGSGPGKSFASVSLWKLNDLLAGPKATVGLAPELPPRHALSFLVAAAHTPRLSVLSLLMSRQPRLGYAFRGSSGGGWVTYAETALPSNRREAVQSNAAFSDLDFAIYFGRTQQPQDLLISTVPSLPLPSPRATAVVGFGTGFFTLVASAKHPLAGSLTQHLPLIIALVGVVLTLLATALTLRLVERRHHAEHLASELERVAAENRWLYAEQREISQSLQHALLPASLPSVAGLQTAARYVAGEAGMEIGGDWYDVIPVSREAVMIVVGDVSGKGLRAASTMASLRFAIHAYAIQRDAPATILSKLSRLLSVAETGQIATVLCAMVNLEEREITLASAGHLPPLLIAAGRGEYLNPAVGVPIGVEEGAQYDSTRVPVPAGATLLAFTDGLVERKNESLDQGLERLRNVATPNHVELPELLTRVLDELRQPAAQDDTALVGIRWTS